MTTRSKSSSASAPLLSYASQSQFRTPAPQISPDTGRVVYLPTHDAALLRIMECLPNATAAEKRAALGWTIIPIDKFRYKMQNLVQKMKKNGVRQNASKNFEPITPRSASKGKGLMEEDLEYEDGDEDEDFQPYQEELEQIRERKPFAKKSVLGKRSRSESAAGNFFDRIVTKIENDGCIAILYSPTATGSMGAPVIIQHTSSSISVTVGTSTMSHNVIATMLTVAEHHNLRLYSNEVNTQLHECEADAPVIETRVFYPEPGKCFEYCEEKVINFERSVMDPPGGHPLDYLLSIWRKTVKSEAHREEEPKEISSVDIYTDIQKRVAAATAPAPAAPAAPPAGADEALSPPLVDFGSTSRRSREEM